MQRILIIFSCFFVLLSGAYASSPIPIGPAKVDPGLRWQTLETEHFSIHFHQNAEELAYRAAFLAENIHARLTKAMLSLPHGKTQIVINDSIDIANGAASPILYNQIFVYPTQPLLGVGHFEDWLEFMLIHEYTHILDTGRVEGFAAAVQSVFGKLWFPKMFISSLFTEGYAVYSETYYSDGGRGRDPYTDMLLRESFLDDDVPGLNELLFSEFYPGGSQPYTYGSTFYQYVGNKYGDRSIQDFQRRLATNIWPWDADFAARLSTSYPLGMLWEEWKQESKQRYRQQKDEIERQGLTASQPLTDSESSKWNPLWSPDGKKLYYFNAMEDGHPEIRCVALSSRQDSSIVHFHTLTEQTAFTLSPDGRQLAFFQIGFHRSTSVYNDLWIRDLFQGRTRRLTNEERIKDPAWSPDGKRILGVKAGQGRTHLVNINVETKQVSVLPPENLMFSEPSWSPDGKQFAVSAWQEGGYQDIWVFDAEGREGRPLLHDKAWDISPCWTPDGKYILFASDRTGVYNLFAYQFDGGLLHQVTNVVGGAFDPSVSPDGKKIAFANYTNDGFNICMMDFNPPAWKPAGQTAGTFFAGYRTQETDNVLSVEQSAGLLRQNQPKEYLIHPYRSFYTLSPRFWLPLVGVDEEGLTVGAITMGNDVLAKHSYAASIQYGPVSQRPSYTFQYINNQLMPSLALSFWDQPEILQIQTHRIADPYAWHRSRGATALVYLPYITAGCQQGFGFGIEAEKSAFKNWPSDTRLPYDGQLVDLFAGWDFSNTHFYPRGISRTDGFELSLIYREHLTSLGSKVNLSEISADMQAYIGMPYDRHVLAWKGSVAYNNADCPRFQPELNNLALRSFDEIYIGSSLFSTLEYRFPIVEIKYGWRSLPVFLEQLHGAIFADYARSLSPSNSSSEDQLAVGGEIRLDAIGGYFLGFRFRTGLAMQIKPERKPRFIFLLGEPF